VTSAGAQLDQTRIVSWEMPALNETGRQPFFDLIEYKVMPAEFDPGLERLQFQVSVLGAR